MRLFCTRCALLLTQRTSTIFCLPLFPGGWGVRVSVTARYILVTVTSGWGCLGDRYIGAGISWRLLHRGGGVLATIVYLFAVFFLPDDIKLIALIPVPVLVSISTEFQRKRNVDSTMHQ